jgi:hypothetical protein
MTQDEIIEMADKADAEADNVLNMTGEYHPNWHQVRDEIFAKLVAEKEREACAKLIEQSRAYELVWYPKGYSINPNKINSFYEFQWNRSMDAIRAREQE